VCELGHTEQGESGRAEVYLLLPDYGFGPANSRKKEEVLLKIAINRDFSLFVLSTVAEHRYKELQKEMGVSNLYFERRDDPLLIQVIEELGTRANGPLAKLKIVEIPDGTDYTIISQDGLEHIAEVHRTWM